MAKPKLLCTECGNDKFKVEKELVVELICTKCGDATELEYVETLVKEEQSDDGTVQLNGLSQ